MEQVIARKIDEVHLKLHTSRSIEMNLKGYFSEKAANFMFHPKWKAGLWSGDIYAYNPQDHLLPIGLLPKLSKYCKANDISLTLDFDTHCLYNEINEEELYDLYDSIFSIESGVYPRDYQHTAILKSLSNKRSIIEASVGAGKSAIIYSIIRYLINHNKKIILIVPNVALVNQMYSDFIEYGWSTINDFVTKLYSGVSPDFNKNVLITTWQSVQYKKEAFFKQYDALLVDETHGLKSNQMAAISKKCVNADIRNGFTGTMPPNKADYQTVVSYLGPVTFNISTKELIDRDVLSKIKINNLIVKYDKVHCVGSRDYDSEMKFITSYEPRRKVLDHIIEKNENNENTLILVHKIDHLKKTEEYLKEKYGKTHQVYVIYGEVKADEREDIRIAARSQGNVLIIGTYATLAVGWNLPRLHNIVFYSSYKSKIKVLQSIGRGLRKHETKDIMVLWDVVDDLRYSQGNKTIDNFIYRHFKTRKQYYEEQGFPFSDSQIKI